MLRVAQDQSLLRGLYETRDRLKAPPGAKRGLDDGPENSIIRY